MIDFSSEHRTVVLASRSPRRLELLRQIGITAEVRPADIDESRRRGESADAYVLRLSQAKAAAISRVPEEIVIAADTTVVCDNEILEKPRSRDHHREMLLTLSGRSHTTMTAVTCQHNGWSASRLSETRVEMTALNEKQIDVYWDSGEPQDKAGGYAIQGLGAVFIKKISGSYSGVMGLPLYETMQLLNASRGKQRP